MKDGTQVIIRPIKAEDEVLGRDFHASLSDKTVYLRYLSPMLLSQRIAHERLARMTHIDYDREIALVVEGEEDGKQALFGVARMSKLRGTDDQEALVTLLISDRYQGKGLGRELMTRLINIGKDEKVKRITAFISPENDAMKKLCLGVGFTSIAMDPNNGMMKAQIDL